MTKMYDEKPKAQKPHNIIMENRKMITISGVLDIDSFDEQNVVLFTDYGDLDIKGKNLHINKLSVESGEVNVEGEIYAIVYNDNIKTTNSGFLSKIFK